MSKSCILAKDRIGQKFNFLTIKSVFSEKHRSKAICLCDCGNEKVVAISNLTSNQCISCGCKTHELQAAPHRTHGKSQTSQHERWCGIKKRINNPKCKSYPLYGGRGIAMHPQWEKSFEAFCDGVGEPPSPKHTLERINNNGNYEPGNVRWATRKEQARNTRRNVLTMEIAQKIRELYKLGGITHKEIASLFSVTKSNVSKVVRMKTWLE